MSKRKASTHHFRGLAFYTDDLRAFADGRPVFTGRGKKPRNKEVLAAIKSIENCTKLSQQGKFFDKSSAPKQPCTCGWHKKAQDPVVLVPSVAGPSTFEPPLKKVCKNVSMPLTSVPPASSCMPFIPVHSVSTHYVPEPSIASSMLGSVPSSVPSLVPPSVSSSVPSMLSVASSILVSSDSMPSGSQSTGPVPPTFGKSDYQSPKISELSAMEIGYRSVPGKLDLMMYCPVSGKCPHCNSASIMRNTVGKPKLCYALPWPKTIVGVDMRCGKCNKQFMTHDPIYVDTLPSELQIKREFVSGKRYATHISLIRLLRSGLTVAQVLRIAGDDIQEEYLRLKSEYLKLWDKVNAMRGVGKVNVARRDAFPPFPSQYVPTRPHLTAMFVKDYWENKPYIMRELRAILSSHSLAVDHQREVVKRTIGKGVVARGRQSFTICGDSGVVCGVYVVPDTSLSWTKKAMEEIVDRHNAVNVPVPQSLYMDCGCCGGKLGSTQPATGSVACLWRSTFAVKLDAMHLMLRIGREINVEHRRRKNFLTHLSVAILSQHEGDRQRLVEARKAARLEGDPTRVERMRFIRRMVGDPESVAKRMSLVLKAHIELDRQCRTQAEEAGLDVENITVADIAYPLVTKRVMDVFQQQLIHVHNGCISDDPDRLPYVKVGSINFHSTGYHLDHYQSFRGTSKVKAVHSVLDRTFYTQRGIGAEVTQRGIGAEVFDARLGWWIQGYNRRRLRTLGKTMPPDSMSPKACEYYISHGVCNEFPDWSIAAPGSEKAVKIGYDYLRMVTGELQSEKEKLDLLDEDKLSSEDVPDPLEEGDMVSASAEMLEELGLDATDLVDDGMLSIFNAEDSVFQQSSVNVPSTNPPPLSTNQPSPPMDDQPSLPMDDPLSLPILMDDDNSVASTTQDTEKSPWKQQKILSEPLSSGAVNEEAREVIMDLNVSLVDQPTSTAALLDQPARTADPTIPTQSMSLDPEKVTDEERAKEKAERKAKLTPKVATPKKAVPKKAKAVPPELQERQARAAARMLELGVRPHENIEGKRRPCNVCHQLKTANDKTPDGLVHRVLGRSNKTWCPYADEIAVLLVFEREQKERRQAAWRRANEAKRDKQRKQKEEVKD